MKPYQTKPFAGFAGKGLRLRILLGVFGFIFALSLAAGSAWSAWSPDGGAAPAKITAGSGSVKQISSEAASCPPLLKAVHHSPRKRSIEETRRSVGAAAARGFVFGVRYALTPRENTSLPRIRKPQICS